MSKQAPLPLSLPPPNRTFEGRQEGEQSGRAKKGDEVACRDRASGDDDVIGDEHGGWHGTRRGRRDKEKEERKFPAESPGQHLSGREHWGVHVYSLHVKVRETLPFCQGSEAGTNNIPLAPAHIIEPFWFDWSGVEWSGDGARLDGLGGNEDESGGVAVETREMSRDK